MRVYHHGLSGDRFIGNVTHRLNVEVFNDLHVLSDREHVEMSCGIYGFRCCGWRRLMTGEETEVGFWLNVSAYLRGEGCTVKDELAHTDFDEFLRLAKELLGGWSTCQFDLPSREDLEFELSQAMLCGEWRKVPDLW
jgi:hypothetical protein